MRALVATGETPGRTRLAEVDPPEPTPNQALVAVQAVSLNRGEVYALGSAAPGWRPGWDLAGEVVRAAAQVAGGGGGGRDTMAQAGGRDPEKLPEAIATARVAIQRALA